MSFFSPGSQWLEFYTGGKLKKVSVSGGAPVAIAIDPRHLEGRTPTCDVYVVAARSAAAWDADPSLVDVRGRPQSRTFDGATIHPAG